MIIKKKMAINFWFRFLNNIKIEKNNIDEKENTNKILNLSYDVLKILSIQNFFINSVNIVANGPFGRKDKANESKRRNPKNKKTKNSFFLLLIIKNGIKIIDIMIIFKIRVNGFI